MLYEDLDKISLSRFIDIFLGDIDKVIIKGQYSQKRKKKPLRSFVMSIFP